MRSIFFTKPKEHTLKCLQYMVEHGEEVLAVVLSGKEAYVDTGLYHYAADKGIRVLDYTECDDFFAQPTDIEMIWCNTFPKKIKQDWIDRASVAAVNFHAAPLPEYRGVFGFNFAFLNNEAEFGVSAHLLSGDFDTGDIIEVTRFSFDPRSDTVRELVTAAEMHILELFKKTYHRYSSGERVPTFPQDLESGTYYSRRQFEESKRILPSDSEDDIRRKVRAFWCPPYEGAYVEFNGKRLPVVTKELLNELR